MTDEYMSVDEAAKSTSRRKAKLHSISIAASPSHRNKYSRKTAIQAQEDN